MIGVEVEASFKSSCSGHRRRRETGQNLCGESGDGTSNPRLERRCGQTGAHVLLPTVWLSGRLHTRVATDATHVMEDCIQEQRLK